MRGRRLLAFGVIVVAALTAATLAAASTHASHAAHAASGSITIAIGGEPSTLDPLIRDDGNERAVTQNIFNTLLGRTADGKKLYPELAAAMPTRVNPTTWQFKLRPGIKFTDGEPFDADSVVASVQHIIDPKVNSEQLTYVSTVKGAQKVNDLTVNITTKGPDPILPSRMYWMRIIPQNWQTLPNFASDPVGTGPYEFVQWARGDHITLKANPSYWGSPKPTIENVTFNFVPEEATQVAGLAAGSYNLITNLLPEDAKEAPKVIATNGLEHPVFILNARPGKQVTANVKVRQALNYALDKNAMAKSLFLGYASVDKGQLLSPDWFGYDPKIPGYGYNVAKAKALIKAAHATGKTLNIVGEVGRWLDDKQMIEYAAQSWRAIGLKVNVSYYAFPTYLNRLFDQKKRPDVIFVSHSNELYDADLTFTTYYEPSGIGASNSNRQVEKWVNQGRTDLNVKQRLALYHQVVDAAYKGAYFVWLVRYQNIWGMSKNLVWQPREDGFIFVNTMQLKS